MTLRIKTPENLSIYRKKALRRLDPLAIGGSLRKWVGRAGWRADRGNAPLELVLIAPVILMMIGLVVAAGRVSTARNAMDAAAREAARQASVATSQAAAQQAAISGATSALAADGLQCQPIVRLLNLSQAFNSPIGEPADIRVRVTCVVRLSDLTVPGVPGTVTLNAVFTSPLDPYRSRNLAAVIHPRQAVSGSWRG